mmetsp:Transcript_46939/g.110528  ORF Transcript_46939/g.110528 Transcript_46939/m.110528 type:complete len:205 (-) Transcript_46939:342-956(-)
MPASTSRRTQMQMRVLPSDIPWYRECVSPRTALRAWSQSSSASPPSPLLLPSFAASPPSLPSPPSALALARLYWHSWVPTTTSPACRTLSGCSHSSRSSFLGGRASPRFHVPRSTLRWARGPGDVTLTMRRSTLSTAAAAWPLASSSLTRTASPRSKASAQQHTVSSACTSTLPAPSTVLRCAVVFRRRTSTPRCLSLRGREHW